MAKVVAGLTQAKAESDRYLTPLVEARRQQHGTNNNKSGSNGDAKME